MDFSGRHVVVTGGTGALGTAVCGRLLDLGATCYVPSVSPAESERCPFQDHDGFHLTDNVDLSVEASVGAFFEQVPGLWASIHIAGGFAMDGLADISAEAFSRMMNMNALTCHLSMAAAVRRMRDAGANGGRIVNVTARPGVEPRGGAGMTHYAASKAAVAALTQAAAEELAAETIWVNAVAPSIIDTPANRGDMPDANHDDWPTPEEIAETIVFLASPENTVTRGAIVPVYGRV